MLLAPAARHTSMAPRLPAMLGMRAWRLARRYGSRYLASGWALHTPFRVAIAPARCFGASSAAWHWRSASAPNA